MIDKIFDGNDEQTSDMREMRKRIASSFEHAEAFLMPFPGTVVARGNFTGDLRQIDLVFIKYVKELASKLFAPENLIIKKVNGEKVRARDFVTYLQNYINVFNGNTLPDVKSILVVCSMCLLKYFRFALIFILL